MGLVAVRKRGAGGRNWRRTRVRNGWIVGLEREEEVWLRDLMRGLFTKWSRGKFIFGPGWAEDCRAERLLLS